MCHSMFSWPITMGVSPENSTQPVTNCEASDRSSADVGDACPVFGERLNSGIPEALCERSAGGVSARKWGSCGALGVLSVRGRVMKR